MFFELFLGLRYLKAKRKQAFISVITLISVVGVMVGVMALIVVLSVMNGFTADLMSKILGVNSHLTIQSYGGAFTEYEKVSKKAERIEGIIATTPFIYGQVMVNSTGYASGAILRGVDTGTAGKVITVEKMIKKGTLASLNTKHGNLPSIILGKELAGQLGVTTGNIVTLLSPQGKLTPLGRAPNSRKFEVTALFDSGLYEFDASMALVSLREAQDFLGLTGRVTGIEVKVADVNRADKISLILAGELGYPFWTQDWKQKNRSLVSALKLEKITMFVILTMIVLVGALNIVSTLVMVVMEKNRDVAILRTMGASARSIMGIFIFQGLLVGIVGTLVGLVAGLGLCHLQIKYALVDIPTDFYGVTTLPILVNMQDVVVVTVAAVMISFLATIYPAWHASRVNPAEALRYE